MAKFIDKAGLRAALAKIVGSASATSEELSLKGLKALITEKTNGIATSSNLETLQKEVHGDDGNGGLVKRVGDLEAKHADGKTVAEEVADGITGKVDKVNGSRLMTDAEGTKLAGIEEDAQVNVIESVAEGTDSPYLEVTTANKAVTVTFSKGTGDDALQTKSDIDSVVGVVPSDGVAGSGLRKEIADAVAAVKGDSDAVAAKVNTLIGDDADKSVRTIANEELAKQLIPDGAKKALDSLQEIAAWIQAHPDDASAMSAKIAALEATHAKDGENLKTVAAEVSDAVSALDSEVAAQSGKAIAAVKIVDGKLDATGTTFVDLPTELKNPNALVIKDNEDTTGISYDGSAAQTFEAESVADVEAIWAALIA